jgi:hypothetical protein
MIEKREKVGTLYLCTSNIDSSIYLASIGVDTTLWHHGLGHMSEKGMQILHKINLFPDLKQIDLDLCEHCVYGTTISWISKLQKIVALSTIEA